MIIELYGLPGQGKTTFAKRLQAEAGYKIIKIRSRFALYIYNILFLAKYPVKFFGLLYFIFKSSPCNVKIIWHKINNTFLHYNAKHLKSKKCQRAIIDQGYFQNFISVFEQELDDGLIAKYLKFVLFPDVLIFFDLDEERQREYVEKRGYYARDDFDEKHRKEWGKLSSKNNSRLKNYLKTQEMKIYYIRNNEDFKNLIKKLSTNGE